MANTLRNASNPLPGSDASIENIAMRRAKKKKKNIFGHLGDAVDKGIRKFILGPSKVTGKI